MNRTKAPLVVVLVTLPMLLMGQEPIDKAYLKCSYEYKWEFDTLSHKDVRDDLLYLLVGNKVSKCYSYYTYICDSLNSTPEGEKERIKIMKMVFAKDGAKTNAFPHKRMTACVYKNYPEGKMTVTDFLMNQNYRYGDEMNIQIWEMGDSTKTVMGHECQQAVCYFRGRHWTAWFAADVPVMDGPWKFGGLPGLIMEVYDMNRQHHFLINGMQQEDNIPIRFGNFEKKNFVRIDRKKFLKSCMNYRRNQSGIIELETGISLGDPDSAIHYDLLERDY